MSERRVFVKDQKNQFYAHFTSSGSPVTGVVSGDLNIDLSKNGGQGQSGDAQLTSFSEVDASDMPGVYHLEFDASVFDTLGEIIFHIKSGKFDTILQRGTVRKGSLSDIKDGVDSVDNTLSNVDSTVNTIDGHIPAEVAQKQHLVDGSGDITPPTDTGIWDIFGDGSVDLKTIDDKVKRSLGLSQENQLIKDHVYDSNGNLTESVIQIYPSKNDLITEQNLTAEYKMVADYDSNNQLIKYEVRREK